MKNFSDTQGHTWSIILNIGTVKKVRDRLGINLLQPGDGDPPLLTRLATDPILLGDVIAVLIEKQFDLYKVTADNIYEFFDGETMKNGESAFFEELELFFRNNGRTDQALATKKLVEAKTTDIKAIEAKIEEISGQ